METYSIETDGAGGYQVRAVEITTESGHIVASFSTWKQAQEWVNAQTQIAMKTANASDVA